MSMARSPIAGTRRPTGSLTISPPGGIDSVAAPPKVSARSDPSTIAPPLSRSATCAPPSASGRVPKALVNTTRTRSPPRLVWTICRSVWLLTDGGGPCWPSAAGPPGCDATLTGAVAQVPTQCSVAARCADNAPVSTRLQTISPAVNPRFIAPPRHPTRGRTRIPCRRCFYHTRAEQAPPLPRGFLSGSFGHARAAEDVAQRVISFVAGVLVKLSGGDAA